ncbi:MAG: HesB/IscA family protein [Bacillaceae bacterium]
MKEMKIEVTEQAVLQVKEMKKDAGNEDLFLRVAVHGGGCSGLSYGLGFEEEKQETDVEFLFDDVRVLVDKESLPILNGVVVDYKASMLGGGFTIDNPNAIATCGCGSSFRTAKNAGTPEEC